MTSSGFTTFDTSLGFFGLAWTAQGVACVQWPKKTADEARAKLAKQFPDLGDAEPPADIHTAIQGVVALLAGDGASLAGTPLDLSKASAFERQVYDVARTIPPGATLTYGEVAQRLGDKLLARDVGQALGRNPVPIIVPCHRVLAAGGKTGGFSAPGGVLTKLKVLEIEGVFPGGQPSLF